MTGCKAWSGNKEERRNGEGLRYGAGRAGTTKHFHRKKPPHENSFLLGAWEHERKIWILIFD